MASIFDGCLFIYVEKPYIEVSRIDDCFAILPLKGLMVNSGATVQTDEYMKVPCTDAFKAQVGPAGRTNTSKLQA